MSVETWEITTAGAITFKEAPHTSKYLGRTLPPKPRRDKDAPREAIGPAALGARF
jgi:hypothetical protein